VLQRRSGDLCDVVWIPLRRLIEALRSGPGVDHRIAPVRSAWRSAQVASSTSVASSMRGVNHDAGSEPSPSGSSGALLAGLGSGVSGRNWIVERFSARAAVIEPPRE
jgi:hypothetical protein